MQPERMTVATGEQRRAPSSTQAVDRAVRLLMAVAFEPGLGTVRELAEYCGLNRSTAHRLLTTLQHHGLVERDPTTQTYQVGYGALSIAHAVDGHDVLVARARPAMERLRDVTNDTVTLQAVRGMQLFVASAAYPRHMMRPINVAGRLLPLHATAMGKMLLACQDDETIGRVLSEPLVRYTTETHSADRLLEELIRIRERGYSTSAGEYEEGLNAVAAPVRDRTGRVVAGVTAVGPAYRLSIDRFAAIGPQVVAAAEEIGRNLSGSVFSEPSDRVGEPSHRVG
jgi:DNA-binding IclR family transcriptional regulator